MLTYNNMKTLIRGFLGYARCIISIDGSYVPALHSNQSSLECFFSRIQYMDKDYSDKYVFDPRVTSDVMNISLVFLLWYGFMYVGE